jgi:uncharacterized membrane protein
LHGGARGRRSEALRCRQDVAATGCEFRKKDTTGSSWSANGQSRRSWVDALHGTESHARSIVKAISWRTMGTIDTFVISWFLTGRLTLAGSIAALEFATKIAWFYLHERIWAMIQWGRKPY